MLARFLVGHDESPAGRAPTNRFSERRTKLRNDEKGGPGGRLFFSSNPSAKMPVRLVAWSLLLAGLGSGGLAGAVMVVLLVTVSSGPPSISSASMTNSACPDTGRSMVAFRSPLPAARQLASPVAVQVQVVLARPASSAVVTTAPSLSSGPALATVAR